MIKEKCFVAVSVAFKTNNFLYIDLKPFMFRHDHDLDAVLLDCGAGQLIFSLSS